MLQSLASMTISTVHDVHLVASTMQLITQQTSEVTRIGQVAETTVRGAGNFSEIEK